MESDFLKFWKKYGEPVTAISIIIFIIFSVVMIRQDQALKKEISLNCGWGEGDYQCYCEKSASMEIKNKIEGGNFQEFNINISRFENVSVAR